MILPSIILNVSVKVFWRRRASINLLGTGTAAVKAAPLTHPWRLDDGITDTKKIENALSPTTILEAL
jgi:hypothetical protein